eukprot:XP_019928599.1 PREDICTED: uncharacterized protein LOC109620474 [Crassostrea gigas]
MNLHQCPQNKSEWDTASQRLQCVDPNSYHCLRTEDGGETEQCLGKVWIQEKMCPEYNSKVGKIDVFSCHLSVGCPTEIYWSNEVYKYPICNRKPSLATTTISSSTRNHDANEQFPTYVYYIIISVALVLLILLCVGICIYRNRKKRGQTSRESENSNFERSTPDSVPLTAHEHQHSSNHQTAIKLKKTDSLVKPDCNPRSNPHISDVEDLEKNGVLIFISDDKMGIGKRMNLIEESGKFGDSRYISPLVQWEQEDDVSLYLFRQPIDDMSSFLEEEPSKMNEMFRASTNVPKTYFVLYFSKYQWQKYQIRLLKYDFFKKATTRFLA